MNTNANLAQMFPPSEAAPTPQGITFLLVEQFTQLAFACAVEPFRLANLISGEELYRWRLASVSGVQATSSAGIATVTENGLDPAPRGEQLFVLSGLNAAAQAENTPELLAYLRREKARGTHIGALCSGALILAHAGLLDGEAAAVHWQYHDSFEEAFPSVTLRRSVFVSDSRHPTASGGTAAADLMLHLIGQTHGDALAIEIADQMVYNAVRQGGEAQRISVQARHGIRNTHVAQAIHLISISTESPLSPGEIAKEIGISTRQLERLFEKHMRCSPKKYATDIRLQKARNLLLQTEISVTEIAHACGFGSTSQFSRVYKNRYGVSPTSQRAVPAKL